MRTLHFRKGDLAILNSQVVKIVGILNEVQVEFRYVNDFARYVFVAYVHDLTQVKQETALVLYGKSKSKAS